ncbi:MAG TPA: carboxymuconolactone decarboxylase family protein [Vicinamibacterales bacterium]|nr:carboxymuconolactone decarboxylase family protein [Vicinamibacterales bacterium]
MRALFAAALLATGAVMAHAQDRMPPIAAEKLTDAQKQAIADFKAARSAEVSGPFVPLLRSPEVMTRARAMGDYLRFRSTLPPRLSEFLILVTSRRWTQNYEWYAHEPLARRAGVAPEVIAAIAEGRRPTGMTDEEEILYAFWDELQRNQSVSDATYARAVEKFGEAGVIDAVGITGYYTMLAMVMNTARTPLPDGAKPALAPLPR